METSFRLPKPGEYVRVSGGNRRVDGEYWVRGVFVAHDGTWLHLVNERRRAFPLQSVRIGPDAYSFEILRYA